MPLFFLILFRLGDRQLAVPPMNLHQAKWALIEGRQVQHYEYREPMEFVNVTEQGIALVQPSPKYTLALEIGMLDVVPVEGDRVLLLAGEYERYALGAGKRFKPSFDWGCIRTIMGIREMTKPRLLSMASSIREVAVLRPYLIAPLRCFAYFDSKGDENSHHNPPHRPIPLHHGMVD